MEETLWFALGSLAGGVLGVRGRPLLMAVATAAIRAGNAASGAASRFASRISALTAEQRKSMNAFVEEARSKARGAGGRAPEATPPAGAEVQAPA